MKPFVPPDAAGMKDYFTVYEKQEAELNAYLLEVCREIPTLGALLNRMTPQQLDQQRLESMSLLRKAVDGDWKPLLANQRSQGATYATMNISFAEWFDLIGAFQKVMIPHLVKAY